MRDLCPNKAGAEGRKGYLVQGMELTRVLVKVTLTAVSAYMYGILITAAWFP